MKPNLFTNLFKSGCVKIISGSMLLLSFLPLGSAFSQSVVIGSTSSSTSYFYGPYYRSSSSSSFDYSRYAYIYTAAELNIPSGAIITEVAWYKASGTITGNNTFNVWLENSSNTALTSGTAWSALVASATQVYTSTTQSFTAASNSYESFTLTTPFTYTGGSLQILTDHEMNGSATAANNFYYNSASGMAIGYASSAAPSATTTLSSSSYGNNRPTIKITYIPGTPCSGQPTAGTVPATMNVCPNDAFLLSTTGATLGSGMSNQWQYRSPATTGPWVDITGATNQSYNVTSGITTPTDYRYITVCNSVSLSDTSSVIAVSINPPNMCYCVPSVNTATSYYITSFSTTLGSVNITNNNTSSSPGGYIDYTTTDTVEATQGTSVDFSMTTNSGYVSRAIYVDWDQNGSFADPGEEVYSSTYPTTPYSMTTVTGTIPVPITALAGSTHMRVRSAYYSGTVMDPCDNLTYGESEDYTFTVIQATPCANVTFPTSVGAEVDQDTLCVSGDISLSLSAAMPVASGITYQWQSSPDGTTWTDIGTPQMAPELAVTGVSSATDYRCEILCSGTIVLTSSDVHVHVNNPQLTGTPQGGTRCGPGTVGLSATASASTGISWYEQPTGGLPFATGANVQSPYIANTTDFYVAGNSGSSPATAWIGTGTSTTTGQPNPFYTTYWGNKVQMLISAAELQAAGLGPGMINSIGFDVLSVSTTLDLTNFTIKVGTTTISDLTTTFESGLTQVFSDPSYTVQPNVINTFTFSSPIPWDGVSNIIIETCFANAGWNGSQTISYTSGLGFNASHYNYEDNNPNHCTTPTGSDYTSTSRPNIQFDMTLGCEGPRQTVTAMVTPAPTFSIDYDSVVCNDAVRPISVSSPLGNYNSYVWTPSANLYTDAAGTIAYTGTSASTVYFKADISGEYTYAVAATNGPLQTDCAAADTAIFWVQPGNVTIAALPDTICVAGTTDLKLVPDSNYYPGTIQWQESSDGINYNDIAGANTETYTTPLLSTEHYYKALIGAQAGICESPDKHILIADPTIISTSDSFNCGPGSVTLQAEVGANSGVKWYDEATGGLPIGMGSPFATPILSQTDTFYVVAGVGGTPNPPTFVGSGTGTTSGQPNPFYTTYWGNKVQMLVKASELQAAGFSAGSILKIGFDVLSVSTSLNLTNFTISMKSTTLTDLTTTFETGMTQVFTDPAYVIQSNAINEFTLSTPFPWDGSSNIIIETCFANSDWNGSQTIRYSSGLGFTASHYNYEDGNLNHCTTPTGSDYTSTSRPNIQFTMSAGCESDRQPVIAHIYPIPQVDLGENINECVDSGAALVLNAGLQPDQPTFLWDDGSASQVRSIDQSGTYYVAVTNQYTCVGSDTVNVLLRNFPEVELGNDTTVCEGITVKLDAGDDGIQYFWNTGENVSEIIVDNSGSYAVLVTNDEGCTAADTVTVTMSGQLPTMDGIQVTNNAGDTFVFDALNAQNVAGYEWDFGDGSPHSFLQTAKHKYPADGNYLVTLKLSSLCGYIMDSTAAHIVGIHDLNLNKDELSIYPNPTKEKATILNKGAGIRMERVEVFTILGRKIYSEQADSPTRHELSLSGFASGMYTIRIQTNKGNVARKLELIK